MRRATRRIGHLVPERVPVDDTLFRTPLAEAEHPGVPILIKTQGRARVHQRSTRRFRADLEKAGFFQHIAPGGGAFETEFLDEAIELFDEVLLSAESRSQRP